MEDERLVEILHDVISDRITEYPNTPLLRKPDMYRLTGDWMIYPYRWCLADRVERSLVEYKSMNGRTRFQFHAYDEYKGDHGKRIEASLLSNANEHELPLIWVYTYLYNGYYSKMSEITNLLNSESIRNIRIHHTINRLWVGPNKNYYRAEVIFNDKLKYVQDTLECIKMINQLIAYIEEDVSEVITNFVIINVDDTYKETVLFDSQGNKINTNIKVI